MLKETKQALIRKRHAELECLGLPPQLYYSATKLLDRGVNVIMKDGNTYFYRNNDSQTLSDPKKKTISPPEMANLLASAYGIEKLLATSILNEWLREKIIYVKMMEQSTRFWEFLSLPTMPDEDVIGDAEYKF